MSETRLEWSAVRERLAAGAAEIEQATCDPVRNAHILRDRARKLAGSVAGQTDAALHAVLFHRSGSHYGFDLAHLQEIQVCGAISRLPLVPHFCLGVTNVRGEILPVFDLPPLLVPAAPAESSARPNRVLIIDWNGTRIGVGADEVDDAIPLTADEIQPPLATFSAQRTRVVHGIARGALLIDCRSLIETDALMVG